MLAQLLSLGIDRWGQLDTLLETTELAVVEDRTALESYLAATERGTWPRL